MPPRRPRGGSSPPDPALVRFPGLRIDERRGTIRIQNPAHATHVECSAGVRELLDFFAEPHTRAELAAVYDVDAETIDELERQAVLVPAAHVELMRTGMLAPPARPIGLGCRLPDLAREAREGGFAILGVPSDRGARGEAGARHGPEEIRRAFPFAFGPDGAWPDEIVDHDTGRRHRTRGMRALDLGDVQHLPADGLDLLGARVDHVVRATLDAGLAPVVLGGDHSVTWHVLPALLDRHPALGVLHFDAHSDLYGSVEGTLHHGNPFGFALAHPRLAALRQVGLRGLESAPPGARWRGDRRLTQVSCRAACAGPPEAILEGLPLDVPWYVSVDVDVLAPEVAPETGTPVVGGLTADRLLQLVDTGLHGLRVVGMDVVEVGAPLRHRNGAAVAAARCVAQFLLSRAPFRAVRPGWYDTSTGW